MVYFDLVADGLEGYNKFIPYYLFPESLYTVSVSTSTFRTKVSVGSNPWAKQPLKFNLATICERYGGGGHPGVGAISFEIGAIERARQVAREIAAELGCLAPALAPGSTAPFHLEPCRRLSPAAQDQDVYTGDTRGPNTPAAIRCPAWRRPRQLR